MTERARKAAYGWVANAISAQLAWDPSDPETRLEVLRIREGMRAASGVPLSPTAADPTQPSGAPPARLAETWGEDFVDLEVPGEGTVRLGPHPALRGAEEAASDEEDEEDEEGPYVEDHCPECEEYESECACEEEPIRGQPPPPPKAGLGPLPFAWWCERCDSHVETSEHNGPCPKCGHRRVEPEGAEEVRPVASRLEKEEAGRGSPPPPEEQGPAAVEGLPPASVSRTDVTAADSFCDEVLAWVNRGRPAPPLYEGALYQSYRDHLHDCASCARVVQLRIAEEEAGRS